jgi:hypothetical protein
MKSILRNSLGNLKIIQNKKKKIQNLVFEKYNVPDMMRAPV